jgi:hypothetical protein
MSHVESSDAVRPCTTEHLLKLLKCAVHMAYSYSLSTLLDTSYQRHPDFDHPKIGELVMELSTVYLEDRDDVRFGYLLSDQQEPMFTEEEWAEVKDQYERRPTERVIRIRSVKTGVEHCWTNAKFIRVPVELLSLAA